MFKSPPTKTVTGSTPVTATTLALGALLDVASTVLCVHVARLVVRRLPEDRSHSTEAFALFWYAVALVNLLQAALETIAIWRDPGVPLALATWNTRIALALIGFAGLVYYLGYVYTGRKGIRTPLILLYTTTFLLMQAWLNVSQAVSTEIDGWRVGLHFANPARTPLYDVVVVLFFVPPLLAAIAYAFTLRFASDPDHRRRVRWMSASLAVYFAGLTAGYLSNSPWWGLVENLLGIGAELGAMVALRAPREPGLRDDARRGERHAALAERVRQLV
jgi:hypothetical protein